MKSIRIWFVGLIMALSMGLASCSSLGNSGGVGEKALGNLEFCERTYTANLGGIMPPVGSLHINCPARPIPLPPAP